jgi:hypothetical protein
VEHLVRDAGDGRLPCAAFSRDADRHLVAHVLGEHVEPLPVSPFVEEFRLVVEELDDVLRSGDVHACISSSQRT